MIAAKDINLHFLNDGIAIIGYAIRCGYTKERKRRTYREVKREKTSWRMFSSDTPPRIAWKESRSSSSSPSWVVQSVIQKCGFV
jgi:hypothetical protein